MTTTDTATETTTWRFRTNTWLRPKDFDDYRHYLRLAGAEYDPDDQSWTITVDGDRWQNNLILWHNIDNYTHPGRYRWSDTVTVEQITE